MAATLDLDVGLIHPPRAICHPKMRPYALLNLRRVALRPARHGRVVNRDPAIRQHALHISEADRELKIPPDRPKDNLRRKLRPLNAFALLAIDQSPRSRIPILSHRHPCAKFATESMEPSPIRSLRWKRNQKPTKLARFLEASSVAEGFGHPARVVCRPVSDYHEDGRDGLM